MKKRVAGIFLLITILGCNTQKKLEFSYDEIGESDCSGCAKVSINLPKAVPESEVSNQINLALTGQVIELLNFSEKEDPANLKEAIALFEKSYFELQAEYLESPDWDFSVDGEITYESPNLLCAQISSYIFTGGAHGYNSDQFLLFDPKTGELLEIEDIFNDLEGFKNFAEKKFRLQEGIPENTEINSTGYLFDENVFELPENIGFEENQVVFIYNQYEIASYASGQIILEIPIEKAIPFMKIKLL